MSKSCFVIMPIGEYGTPIYNHFLEVYEDLFKPAIETAGFTPIRADEEVGCNVIQCDIIKKIIESDMVLCDLSGKNPNVLYELGIRQAFDLPVVLVQEQGTDRIFDINIIRTIDYDRNLNNRALRRDIDAIAGSINKTVSRENGINSMIQFIGIEKKITESTDGDIKAISTMLNSFLSYIQDIEDGQNGIYELLDDYINQNSKNANDINEKWSDIFDTYLNVNRKITEIIRLYSNTYIYKLLPSALLLLERNEHLPSKFYKDISDRVLAFKRIVNKLHMKFRCGECEKCKYDEENDRYLCEDMQMLNKEIDPQASACDSFEEAF